LAFGTFLGLPEPKTFLEGRDFIGSRWRVKPSGALGAECAGQTVGSNLATAWGRVGFFGPLTVRPDFWDQKVGTRLLEGTIALFDSWGVRHAGLFTFAQSPKHIGLYQKFGFFPRFLTAIMAKPLAPSSSSPGTFVRYSTLPSVQQDEALRACRHLTESLFEGLDLESEIRAVHLHHLGDTLLVWEGSQLVAFAVCHFGTGTEGGPGCCYVKFAAARPGPDAGKFFERLLNACEALGLARGLLTVEAGVNLARDEAYRRMLAHGFRTFIQGVAMHKPNEAAYNRPDALVIDDWR
jgi:hypothetical protein